jgi:hypothetical protein
MIVATALGAAAFGSGGASAQMPGDEVFILSVAANPARCNLGRARRVALVALVRDYRSLRGRCVAVRGFWLGSGLFRRARDADGSDAFYSRSVAPHRIGLYGRREIMDLTYSGARLEVTAVGTLGSCETLGDPGVTVLGYCHSVLEGPYLALAEMYLEP